MPHLLCQVRERSASEELLIIKEQRLLERQQMRLNRREQRERRMSETDAGSQIEALWKENETTDTTNVIMSSAALVNAVVSGSSSLNQEQVSNPQTGTKSIVSQ